jgi:hypothetical protein
VYHMQDIRHIKNFFFYVRAGTDATFATRIFLSLCKNALPSADPPVTQRCTANGERTGIGEVNLARPLAISLTYYFKHP